MVFISFFYFYNAIITKRFIDFKQQRQRVLLLFVALNMTVSLVFFFTLNQNKVGGLVNFNCSLCCFLYIISYHLINSWISVIKLLKIITVKT